MIDESLTIRIKTVVICSTTAVMSLNQEGTNSGCQVNMATKLFTVAYSICGTLVLNFLHVILMAHGILKCILIFGKFVYPMV
jgi:hypothetical protein